MSIRSRLSNTRNGFSLVELMIALTLGLIITGVIVQVFTSTRSTNDLETGLSQVQEQGRFAMEFLARDIRQAGNFGCAKLKPSYINNIVAGANGPESALSDPYNVAATQPVGLIIYEYTGTGGTALTDWTPLLPGNGFFDGLGAPGPELIPFSDVIVVQYATPLNVQLFNPGGPTNANIQLIRTPTTTGAFQAGDVVFISDCRRADIFRATAVSSGGPTITLAHGASGNTQPLLDNNYGGNASVMKLATRAYFIGVNRTPVPALQLGFTPEPALYRLALDNNGWVPQPLVEGIEQLKLLMGIEAATVANSNRGMAESYVTPIDIYRGVNAPFDATANWDMSKVVDIKVGFIARSTNIIDVQNVEQNVVMAETNLPIFGAPNEIYRATPAPAAGTFDPELYRRRRLFTMTVQKRN